MARPRFAVAFALLVLPGCLLERPGGPPRSTPETRRPAPAATAEAGPAGADRPPAVPTPYNWPGIRPGAATAGAPSGGPTNAWPPCDDKFEDVDADGDGGADREELASWLRRTPRALPSACATTAASPTPAWPPGAVDPCVPVPFADPDWLLRHGDSNRDYRIDRKEFCMANGFMMARPGPPPSVPPPPTPVPRASVPASPTPVPTPSEVAPGDDVPSPGMRPSVGR